MREPKVLSSVGSGRVVCAMDLAEAIIANRIWITHGQSACDVPS